MPVGKGFARGDGSDEVQLLCVNAVRPGAYYDTGDFRMLKGLEITLPQYSNRSVSI